MTSRPPTINETLTQGEIYVRQYILDGMEYLLPPVMDLMKSSYGLADEDLPPVSRYDRKGPPLAGLGGAEVIVLSVAVLGISNLTTIDVDDNIMPQWKAQYRVRLYSFVKADDSTAQNPQAGNTFGYERVVRLRSLVEASVRNVLLTVPNLVGTPDAENPKVATGRVRADGMTVAPSTINHVAQSSRWISGVYHEFVFENEEQGVGVSLGTANKFTIQTTTMPRE